MSIDADTGGDLPQSAVDLHAADAFVGLVDTRLDDFLTGEQARWQAESASLAEAFETLRTFVASGGKRVRPRFLYWGNAAGGGEITDQLVDLGASLELLHAFALIHDDVMDGSDTRRGVTTVHHNFIDRHVNAGWYGEPRRNGEGLAILIGDLAFAYSMQLTVDTPAEIRRLLDETRIELHMGQYLDLVSAASGAKDEELTRSIARYKTATYTVERPLQLGAGLAGRTDLWEPLSVYGLAVGEAFQHRDDLLGVFGDPDLTGKPVGDDLRSGKATLLLAKARPLIDPAAAAVFDRIGTDNLTEADIETIIDALITSGAVAQLEAEIQHLIDTADAAIASTDLPADVETALRTMAQKAAWRPT